MTYPIYPVARSFHAVPPQNSLVIQLSYFIFSSMKFYVALLFNLYADPGEMNNLAKSKPNHPILQKLRAKTIAGSSILYIKRKRFMKAYQVQSRYYQNSTRSCGH